MPPNIRLVQPEPEPPDAITVALDGGDIATDPSKDVAHIELPDGSITINFGNISAANDDKGNFYDNLAERIGDSTLSSIAEDLLRGIEQDERSREEWLEDRAEGIRLLALKVKKGTGDVAASDAGMSQFQHPMLLDAVLRFQANARGELLPTNGPVKIRDDSVQSGRQRDAIAQALETDFNHYLTAVATEYYPDTDRMLLFVGFGGSGFKKVYRCPIRRRPVSESVDAADLIVSNAATDMGNADRITHRIKMRPATLKRMQILGAYRDIDIGAAPTSTRNAADEAKENVSGVSSAGMNPVDEPHEIYESLCLLDVPGFEHKEGGEATGLPLPYKVTLDKASRTVLEVRRNWDEEDEAQLPKKVFVKYPFVPGFGFYDLGLCHIMGNPTVAATALHRIMIDNGMFANFPGFLYADDAGRQETNIFRVSPGGGAPIKTAGRHIQDTVMGLPYKETGGPTAALAQELVATGKQVGGAAEIQVGEGKQDAPVGTTIALIEQATKVMDAVHKRLHQAQSEEFGLLKELFRDNPEDFWRLNRKPAMKWDEDNFLRALDDNDLVPAADPNTSSHLQRVMRAQALFMMAKEAPQMFNLPEVQEYMLETIGISNPQSFMATPGQSNKPPDPKGQAALIVAQAKMTEANTKQAGLSFQVQNAATEDKNRDQDRQADLEQARMASQRAAMAHSDDLEHEKDIQAREALSDHVQQARAAAVDQAAQQREADAALAQQQRSAIVEHVGRAHDQAHDVRMAKLNADLAPAPPKGGATKRARGGRVDGPHNLPPGARKAPDGHWYVRAPHAHGLYQRVVLH